jgi:hypothetical protein
MPNKHKLWLPDFNSRPLRTLLVALMLAFFLTRFAAVGWQRMLLNSDSVEGDQGAYLQLGLDLREHGVLTDGTRNPLYPLLLATFADREWHYFTYAKFLSLALGLASVLLIYYVGYFLFDLPTALLSAFLLSINMEFILHSTFVLAESLLVLCILGGWLVMVRSLRNPDSALLWGVAGGLMGLAYLAKGTGQLVAGCFVLAALLLHGLRFFRHRSLWAFVAAYSVVALPLWIYNWQVFGSPTFNFAITHQMWMDRWEENFVRDMNALPTMWSYWRNHSWQEALGREGKGLMAMRFFLAKMLWPTRSLAFDHFLLSGWSGVALVVGLGGILAARRSVWAFVRRHRQAVILTALMSVVFYVLFAWYIAIVPIPIRFMLPLLPIGLLFVSAGLVGIGRRAVSSQYLGISAPAQAGNRKGLPLLFEKIRWAVTAPRLPVWSRVVVGLGTLALVLFVGRWFVLSGLANAQAFRQSPFDADSAFNSDSEQPLLWVRSGYPTGSVGVLIGPGSSLPAWRHSDRLRFVRLPIDLDRPEDFEAFLIAKDVEYVIVDANMAERGRKVANHLLGVRETMGDRVVFGALPAGWAFGFAYPDMPCKWCVFRRMANKPPTHASDFILGSAIHLVGYDVVADEFRPGGNFTLTLYWESLQPVVTDYTVFTQLLGPDWQLYGQVDRQPVYGQWPTSQWLPGQEFVDKFIIPVRDVAPNGEYVVLVGLYDLNTGQRIPVTGDGERVPDDALALCHLTIGEKAE